MMNRFFNRKQVIWIAIAFLIGFLLIPSISNSLFRDIRKTWSSPLSGIFMIIDPGHGGPDGGAVNTSGIVEKVITLEIALYLRDYLQEAGALVLMTREKDTDLAEKETKGLSRRKAEDLMHRVRLANEKKANCMISIHLNSMASAKWTGAQTFYNPIREENRKLASFIQHSFIQHLGNTNRFPKQKGDVYLLKETKVPTALIEVGFLSNPEEAKLMATTQYQKKVAAAIYYGLIGYYNKDQVPKFQ